MPEKCVFLKRQKRYTIFQNELEDLSGIPDIREKRKSEFGKCGNKVTEKKRNKFKNQFRNED